MKKLTQKKLYMVVINMGGWVHEEVYELRRSRNEYDDDEGYDYWDRGGDNGFLAGEKRKLGAYKRSACWEFLFEDKKEAQTFLDGAMAAKQFLFHIWK